MVDKYKIEQIKHAIDWRIAGSVDNLTIKDGILTVTVVKHHTFHNSHLPNIHLIDDEIELWDYPEIRLEFTWEIPVEPPLNVSQLARDINKHIEEKLHGYAMLVYPNYY